MKNAKDLSDGEVMYYNWNRMAQLSRIANKTDMEKTEETMRRQFQNAGDVASMRQTLLPFVITNVDKFMRAGK